MIDILLSASVPLPSRNRDYYKSADILLIRESIKALIEVVLPIGRITFGGHPAITPLISFFVQEAGFARDRLTIFQSHFFESQFPKENTQYCDVRVIKEIKNDREASLQLMRTEMIMSRNFRAAVFIGGMEGVIEEAALIQRLQPDCEMLPIASTGAAAMEVFKSSRYSEDLSKNLTYSTLFRRRLINTI